MSEIEKLKHIDPKQTKAILIGVSEFQDKSFVNAPPIKNNVEKLADILHDENILGLPEKRILVLNKNENHNEILRAIREFVGDKSDDFADTVIFYFAGHGYKTDNDEFFLVTQNTDKDDIDITSIPWKKIKDILEKGNGIQQRLYILDACHSGAAALGENDTETEIAEGSLLIAAAKADEKSYFNSTDPYTHFTNAFINILENGIDKTDAQQIDTNSLFDNLDKILRDKKFEITKKATHKIENVSFFKNVRFDNEIEKIREIEVEIEKATKLIFEKQYKTAQLILKGLHSDVEALKSKEKLLKKINRKIEDCQFLPRYHKEIEIHFNELIQQKEAQITKLSENLKIDKSTITKLEKQLQETEKQLTQNLKNADEITQLTTQKKMLQKQLDSQTQMLKEQTTQISDLQTQLKSLQNESKSKINFDIEILEQAQQFVEKREGKWDNEVWKQFSSPLLRKYAWQNDAFLGQIVEREKKFWLHKNDFETQINKLQSTIKQDQVIYNKLKTEKETIEKELQNLKNPPKPKVEIITPKQTDELVWQNDKHGIFNDPRDGKKYKVVKIGSQIWLAENLNFTKDIPQVTDKAQWKKLGNNDKDAAWCYYDNKPENGEKYGALYNWAAALKVAPKGWHLPTKEEFEALLQQFGGGEKAYKALIEDGNSDLNVRFAGWRYYNGTFNYMGSNTGFWSATESSNTAAWNCNLDAGNESAGMDNYSKSVGLSVRLLRD